MSKKPNMLATATPWDMVAAGYAETSMQMLQAYTEEALALLDYKAKEHILDVACGPGTLALLAAEHVSSVCALDFSESMLTLFRDHVEKNNLNNIEISAGDGQALPYENNRFDAAFSMFGLMFFPDRSKGFSEMYRTMNLN